MDPTRVNTYNLTATGTGTYTNALIQGAQRWQKLVLSTAGKLVITNVGFVPSTSTTPIAQLPGSFSCSDARLNAIWEAGARTLQLTEIPARSIPNYWGAPSSRGALVDSRAPQPYNAVTAYFLMYYEVEFDVSPVKGGFGVIVLSDTLGAGIYIDVSVTLNEIRAYSAWPVDETNLLANSSLQGSVTLNEWYHIKVTVALTDISLTINGVPILAFSQFSYFVGSFGLGTSIGDSAYYKNLNATSATGEPIYFSTLTDESFFDDFLIGTNPASVVVDGARRDRISYAGDLDLSTPSTFASTSGTEFVEGTLDLLGASQLLPGFFVPNAKIQQSPRTSLIPFNITGLIGYSFNLVAAMGRYYDYTGNVTFAKHWASPIASFLDWVSSQTNSNGLFNITDRTISGDWNYYDPALVGAVTKFNTLWAYAFKYVLPLLGGAGEQALVEKYQQQYATLKTNIANHLWTSSVGAFGLSDTIPNVVAQDANALAILADIPIPTSSGQLLKVMGDNLFTPYGALAFSNSSVAIGFQQKMSAYSSGYHLLAAFYTNDSTTAEHLLYTLWADMVNVTNLNYTGTLWETSNPDGTPGLGLSTSLCHAWATAPTAALSQYVLGVRSTQPGFTQWVVSPQTLNLDWASGKHPTPYGAITVSWRITSEGLFEMNVTAPASGNTTGLIFLPDNLRVPLSTSNVLVGGEKTTSFPLQVSGQTTVTIKQEKLISSDSSSASSGFTTFSNYLLLLLAIIIVIFEP